MRIFKYLMLGLLATSTMVPAINAAGETKEDAPVRRVFPYDAPACHAEKELYFKFKSLFSSVCKEMGARIEGLQEYLIWKPREDILPTMRDGFQQALTQGIAQLHVALDTTPSPNHARVLGLFEALATREFRIYESLFAEADELIGYLNTTTLSTASGTGNYVYYNGCSISISSTNSEQQFHYLNVAQQLSFESSRLKVFNPSLIETNQAYWSLLAYLTNSNEVRATNGHCYPVKQEVLDVFHAYVQGLDPRAAEYKFLETMLEDKDYTYDPPLHFDLAEASKIAAIMAGGKPLPLYTSQPPIVIKKEVILAAARVEGWNSPVVRYVPTEDVADGLVRSVGKMAVEDMPPPPPRVVETFSGDDKVLFNRITTTLETIHAAQEAAYKAGQKYGGYSEAEQIMAYGNESVIPATLRADVYQLLTRQLQQRGIGRPYTATFGYDAAASSLVDWIREKTRTASLAVNLENVVKGMEYTKNQAKNSNSSSDQSLFDTVWALKAMSAQYENIALPEGQTKKDEIESLLMQSFNMLDEHFGRCGTGAKGRNFLMQMAMLRFFKNYDPTVLA